MGMITRVRGRVRANSLTVTDKEKTAQSICLLSAVLLLPFCPRSPLPFLPPPACALYSILVIPVVLSANYRYPISALKTIFEASKDGAKSAWRPLKRLALRFYTPIDKAENLFLKMQNFSVMVNQIVFLMLADKLLVSHRKMISVYTLIFYNVIAYAVSYIKELIKKEDRSPYVTLTERVPIKHLAMSTTKIVLEWTKAVVFVVTIIFILLVFSLEQGLNNYKPSTFYTITTWMYYSATEKVFADMFPPILAFFQLETLGNIENLYAPVILRCFTITISALFTTILLLSESWKFILIATYLNVYLRSKELLQNSGATLQKERQILNQYRIATKEELDKFDDICAVCLCCMTKARITPCHHLFHADCLRQCLKFRYNCPMCMRELKFD